MDALIRDALELAIVFSIGATLVAVVLRIKNGQVRRVQCSSCKRPTSRLYEMCPRCNGPLESVGTHK